MPQTYFEIIWLLSLGVGRLFQTHAATEFYVYINDFNVTAHTDV
jgi:hypothetical protein